MSQAIDTKWKNPPNKIAAWLFLCCFCIFIMVVIGGITRLTESGLSITQWQPVSGIIPPLTQNAWQEEFFKYQQSPEYLKKNFGISLQEFKNIFWLEFIHRLFGRITGVVFLFPLVFFAIKQNIRLKLALKLGGIFILGAVQGIIGWYMVKSGLKEAPHVSQYWLSFHLGMAFLIYGLVLQSGLSEYNNATKANTALQKKPATTHKYFKNKYLTIFSCIMLICIFLQSILGAFVAGTHAGLIYNTFPDMNGQFVPDGLFIMQPWHLNLFENTTSIQFNHRIFAYLTSIIIITFWLFSHKFTLTSSTKYAIAWLPIIIVIQLTLGISTLLAHVPVLLASMHQIFALVLFTLVIFITHAVSCRSQ